MSAAPVYMTLANAQADTGNAIRQISMIPSCEWVAMIRASQLTPGLLQALCDLANAYSGAKPPTTIMPS
jgi:hypothetical protein